MIESAGGRPGWLRPVAIVLVGALAGWLSIFAIYRLAGYEPLGGDVIGYWQDSQTLGERIDAFHMPGYPAVIAAGHWLLPGVPYVRLAQGIGLIAWLVSALNMLLILQALGLPRGWQGALLYAWFPFVGLVEIVSPRADALAALVLTAGVLFAVREQRLPLIMALGLSLLVHKALWPFAALLAVGELWRRRLRPGDLALIGLPLAAYWLYGALRGGDVLWIVRANVGKEIASQGALPVLDGLLGGLLAGGPAGLLRTLPVLLCFGLAVALLIIGRQRWHDQPALLALILPIVMYGVLLNQHEIWALVRYSRFLILPLWAALAARGWLQPGWRFSLGWLAAMTLALLTQYAFALYRIAPGLK